MKPPIRDLLAAILLFAVLTVVLCFNHGAHR